MAEVDGDNRKPVNAYDGLSRSQLIALLHKRDAERRLGLVWERNEIDVDHAIEKNFVVADLIPAQSELNGPWPNLVIEGDNYDALRWLRMTHRGQIKCIYIDPPYNTGNKDWVYNDRYVDPNHRYRQSQWLEFLYQRFLLARDLLSPDGVLLCSINDENRSKLELMMDQALPGMRVGSLVWRTKDTANDAEYNFSSVHEHILIYGNIDFSFLGYLLDDGKYTNPDGDSRGIYASNPITQPKTRTQRENGYYPIQDPETGWWYPCNPNSVWRYASEMKAGIKQNLRTETIESLIRDNRIIFPAKQSVTYQDKAELLDALRRGVGPADGKGRPLLTEDLPDIDFWINKPIALGRPSKKLFWNEKDKKVKPVGSYILGGKEIGNGDLFELRTGKQGTATDEVTSIFGSKVFDYPKPTQLIKSILEATLGPNDTVLDFFAGSATTAQAVMELNAADGGERAFILASSTEATEDEPHKNICDQVTAERIRRLNADVNKYQDLVAGFAYLKCRQVNPLEIDDALTAEAAWSILQVHHGLALNPWPENKSLSIHSTDEFALILIDYWTNTTLDEIQPILRTGRSVFLYAFEPGQVTGLDQQSNVEVRAVRETLQRLFAA